MSLHKHTGRLKKEGFLFGRLFWSAMVAEDPAHHLLARTWGFQKDGVVTHNFISVGWMIKEDQRVYQVIVGPLMLYWALI